MRKIFAICGSVYEEPSFDKKPGSIVQHPCGSVYEEPSFDKKSDLIRQHPFPPSIKSQYDRIYAAILQTDLVSKGVANIITFYSLSFGWKTNFRHNHFTYSCYNSGYPTAIKYDEGAPDSQNALLDFSFCGSCMIRFKIRKKGDEMWLGVVGDLNDLNERNEWINRRRWRGQWSYYLGRTQDHYLHNGIYISRAEYLNKYFKSVLNSKGFGDSGIGSFHFSGKTLHRLLPSNTGDIVDMAVDAQEKTFTVIVNGVLQARSKVPDLPDQLAFFVKLDYTDDCVEFEILDFNFKETRKQKETSSENVANVVV